MGSSAASSKSARPNGLAELGLCRCVAHLAKTSMPKFYHIKIYIYNIYKREWHRLNMANQVSVNLNRKSFPQVDSGMLPLLRFAAQKLGDPTFQEKQDLKTTEAIVKILSTLTDELKNAWNKMNPIDKQKSMEAHNNLDYLLKL